MNNLRLDHSIDNVYVLYYLKFDPMGCREGSMAKGKSRHIVSGNFGLYSIRRLFGHSCESNSSGADEGLHMGSALYGRKG